MFEYCIAEEEISLTTSPNSTTFLNIVKDGKLEYPLYKIKKKKTNHNYQRYVHSRDTHQTRRILRSRVQVLCMYVCMYV